MISTHNSLGLSCLTAEQRAKTCSYWYTLTSGSTAYTAFRTREALEFFLEIHQLKLRDPLPAKLGEHAYIPVEGETRTIMHREMEDMPTEGRRILHMSNGDHTLGLVTEDEKGPVVHYLNPNADRLVFDHAAARAHVDSGHKSPMQAMI